MIQNIFVAKMPIIQVNDDFKKIYEVASKQLRSGICQQIRILVEGRLFHQFMIMRTNVRLIFDIPIEN